jgi:hypothetical protein
VLRDDVDVHWLFANHKRYDKWDMKHADISVITKHLQEVTTGRCKFEVEMNLRKMRQRVLMELKITVFWNRPPHSLIDR